MFLKLALLKKFMPSWLENIVIGESGKKQIREKYSPDTNYPLVCNYCAYPLGILHLTPKTKKTSSYLNRNVKQISGGKVICHRCKRPYDVSKILKANEKERLNFPTEEEFRLEELVKVVKKKLFANRSYR